MDQFCCTSPGTNNNKLYRIDQIWAVEVDIFCKSLQIAKTNDWRVIISLD